MHVCKSCIMCVCKYMNTYVGYRMYEMHMYVYAWYAETSKYTSHTYTGLCIHACTSIMHIYICLLYAIYTFISLCIIRTYESCLYTRMCISRA